MNVLSLFDGMSCGQIALERAGIPVERYFASEIDKYAIQITKKNYPNTVQLGDIKDWKSWKLPKIGLILAGSPCQGFSNAGKGLNFDDPRSKLFFEFMEILRFYSPERFLLENVRMKKEWQDVITEYVGVEPVKLSSALVSAQNRIRLYWANWEITQPEDKHIYLRDIIEDGEVDKEKSYCIDANYYKGGSVKNYKEKKRRKIDNLPSKPLHQSEKRLMVKTIPHGYMKEKVVARDKYPSLAAQDPSSKYLIRDKSKSLRVGGRSSPPESRQVWDNIYKSKDEYRKLTVIECERLQTVPDNYTGGVSNTQRYKMLGNGWTIDMITHILKCAYSN